MAEPTSKISRSRRGMRRSHHFITPKSTSVCPQCNAAKQPHHVCRECGYYRGREVVAAKN